MRFGLKLLMLVLFCLSLVACGKSAEEKALAETDGSENVQKQTGPECAQFNPDHTPKVKGGCTREQMDEWHKTH